MVEFSRDHMECDAATDVERDVQKWQTMPLFSLNAWFGKYCCFLYKDT